MSVSARTTKKGERRYDVRLRDPGGRRYSKTFRTRREAERFEATQLADRARGNWLDPRSGELTFGEWSAEWLRSDPGKGPSSIARDQSILRVHLLPELAHRPMATVMPHQVQALVTKWSTTAKPRTVRRQYDTLRAVFNAAVQADIIARSPCRNIRLPGWDQEQRPVLDAQSLGRLAAAVGPDLARMVQVAGVLGLRWGEAAGLRVGSIDFADQTITVSEQRTRGVDGGTETRRPKTAAGRRTIAAPGWLIDVLAAHLDRRGLTPADLSALLFVTFQGAGLDYSHWLKRVSRPATTRAGMPGLRFHDLRHTAATALVAEGIDIKTAQVRLGHADPRTTLSIYAHATPQADRTAAERLGERFRLPTSPEVAAAAPAAPRSRHDPARGMDAR